MAKVSALLCLLSQPRVKGVSEVMLENSQLMYILLIHVSLTFLNIQCAVATRITQC